VTKLFVIVLCVGLAACSKKKDEEGKEPLTAPPAPAGAPAAPAVGSAGPGGTAEATGGSASGAAPGATPVGPTAGTPGAPGATTPTPAGCANPTTQHCDAGQTDGCTGGLTSVHVCVAADAKAGAPCAQGAALTCPTGWIDACGYTPPYASNHICIVVPRSTP